MTCLLSLGLSSTVPIVPFTCIASFRASMARLLPQRTGWFRHAPRISLRPPVGCHCHRTSETVIKNLRKLNCTNWMLRPFLGQLKHAPHVNVHEPTPKDGFLLSRCHRRQRKLEVKARKRRQHEEDFWHEHMEWDCGEARWCWAVQL